MRMTACCGTAILLLLPTPSALAQSSDERAVRCFNHDDSFSFEQQIAGCTELLDTGKLTDDGAVFAYFNRGRAFALHKEYARAVVEFTSALKIKPTDVNSLVLRAVSYRVLNDPTRAKADLAQALRLDPGNSAALGEMKYWEQHNGGQ